MRHLILTCGAAGMLAAACSNSSTPAAVGPLPTPQPTFPTFLDVKSTSGVGAAHQRVEGVWSTGQAWGDYDRDGRIDLYVTNENGANTLYHNRGDGTFEVLAVSAEVALSRSISLGAVFADVDNDGWQDLLVLGFDGNVLFHNDGGQHFVDITATAGVGASGAGETASFGDYDNDGYLDLYVANWACATCPDFLESMRDHLYHNRGDGTFADVTALLGSRETVGYGFVAGFVDYDDDGDADIYLVNDKGSPRPLPAVGPMNRNVLWRNDGPGPSGWRFTEVAIAAHADARVDGMGLGVGDFDGDGHLDLAVSNHERPVLLRNQGDGTFADVTVAAGLPTATATWGTVFGDFDNDGSPDLFFAGSDGPSLVLQNRGNGEFRDVTAATGLAASYSMGLATADYDGDGWLDFVIGNWGSGYRLHRNMGLPGTHHWFRARLEGAGGVNRDAVGTRVWVTATDGRVQVQEVMCGSSLGSGNDLALHFGLGAASVASVRIRWPDGLVEDVTAVATDQEWRHRHP